MLNFVLGRIAIDRRTFMEKFEKTVLVQLWLLVLFEFSMSSWLSLNMNRFE